MPQGFRSSMRRLPVLILLSVLPLSAGCDALCRFFGLPAELCDLAGPFGNRPIQDLRVTMEIQFIGVEDDFFERIGVDFDFDFDSDAPLLPASDETPPLPGNIPQDSFLTTPGRVGGQQSSLSFVTRLLQANSLFLPAVQVGGSQPQVDHFVGLPILGDLPVVPNIFSRPDLNNLPGGAMVGNPADVDATSIGFAILSDIEAFFFLQAAQGDTRNNILQAPKVTLFNGQPGNVVSRNERTLITDVEPAHANALLAINPLITEVTSGPQLNVTAVISADRRFIQLNIRPIIAAVGNADQIQVNGVDRLIQLPAIQFTNVQTTVSVPDGGTILLGGIKRMQGGQLERGVPILNKLPYINRLFKNVATIKETQTLLLMVTPRIIIQEEEE